MCTSPLNVNPFSSPFGTHIDVPCGECLECRDSSQLSWLYRIYVEYMHCKDDGGNAIFLTFTYRPSCLPHASFLGDTSIPAFSLDDVKSFLNNLKVKAWRNFGKNSYKYFWVSEYGSHTYRPHYHCLFFLGKGVAVKDFTELCRRTWHYGFMFPKLTSRGYLDKRGILLPNGPIVRNNRCIRYCAKYTCKDLSFEGMQPIIDFRNMRKRGLVSDIVYKHYRKFMPFHLQSKSLGAYNLDHSSLALALQFGVYDGLSQKMVQLPRYYVERTMFSHDTVKIDGHNKVVRKLKAEFVDIYRDFMLQTLKAKCLSLHNAYLNICLADYFNAGLTAAVDSFNKLKKTLVNVNFNELYNRFLYYSMSERARSAYRYFALDDGYTFRNYVSYRTHLALGDCDSDIFSIVTSDSPYAYGFFVDFLKVVCYKRNTMHVYFKLLNDRARELNYQLYKF